MIRVWQKRHWLTFTWEIRESENKSWKIVKLLTCKCDCWNTVEIDSQYFWHKKNCWCFKDRYSKYSWLDTSMLSMFAWMKDRCYSINNKNYKDYWWRWIKVCDRRLQDNWYKMFLEDMWERPAWHSIDRIDNDWDYEPSNCRWATDNEQANNRRTTIRYMWKTIREWSEFMWIDYSKLKQTVGRHYFSQNKKNYFYAYIKRKIKKWKVKVDWEDMKNFVWDISMLFD